MRHIARIMKRIHKSEDVTVPKTTAIPFDSREYLSACRDLIGDTYLINLFKVQTRTLQRWTAKPGYVDEESIRQNPIEKFERTLLRMMREAGGDKIARAIVARLAEMVDCELRCRDEVVPDKDSLPAEMHSDWLSLAELHQKMLGRSDIGAVVARSNEHFDAVKKSVEKYRQSIAEE